MIPTVKQFTFIGQALQRPECIVTTKAGRIYASDRDAAVVEVIANDPPKALASGIPEDFLCNGYSLLPDGSFLMANLGLAGGVWQLIPGDRPQPVLMEVTGEAIPSANFVNAIGEGRDQVMWVSVSTRHVPREQAFRRSMSDGFIIRADQRGVRIVADGLGFTNENKLHPDGEWLYVNETIARRLSRFRLRSDGDLGPRETVCEFSDGIWPDGFEFDERGGIWIASVVSNRLLRLDLDGSIITIVDDSDPEQVAAAEQHFAKDVFSRADIDAGRHGQLGNLASVTFGGPDLKTVYLGSLFSDRLATFRSPVAGAAPHHWLF